MGVGRIRMGIVSVLLGVAAVAAQGAVEPSKIFGSKMVLPRDCAFPVWGKAAPKEHVTVSFAGKSVEATANAKGDWSAKLGPFAASDEGRELTFSGSNKVVFKNVLVGDVFLYAGSTFSNSRFDWPDERKRDWAAEREKIPTFKTGVRFISLESCGASLTPVRFELNPRVYWFSPSDPGVAGGMQVMTWLFASRYYEKTGVPCGIVSASAQFRKNENYLSPAALEMSELLADKRADYLKTLKTFADFGAGAPDAAAAKDDTAFAGRGLAPSASPICCNYNASIHPILRFAFRGAIYVPERRQGWEKQETFDAVSRLITDGWRAGAAKDFPAAVYDGQQDRKAFAEALVKDFAAGMKPGPLPKRAFKAEVPADETKDGGRLEVAGIFGDHMVLQRGRPHPVWGRGKPGAKVTVSYGGKTAAARVDKKGDWVATLPALAIRKEGAELTVTCGEEKKTFTDVLCGDVWHASGQSNMEFSFGWGVVRGKEEAARAVEFPNIRANKLRHARSIAPVTWQSSAGVWNRCTEKSLSGVTAVGYFFARRINAETGVPIGLIDSGWSDSRIEPFIPMCGMRLGNRFAKEADDLLSVIAATMAAGKRASARLAGGAKGFAAFEEDAPVRIPDRGWSSQYNTLIEPLVRFPATGVLWYQGCSNDGKREYVDQLKAFASGWRTKLGSPDLPIVLVQLAGYQKGNGTPAGGDGFAPKREAQREAHLEIPHTGLAVALDVGNVSDIHPKNKLDVGERAALWALRDVYGRKDLVVSGPMLRAMKLEGAKARLSFDSVGGGLVAAEKEPDSAGEKPKETPGAKLKGFSLQAADGSWHFAEGVIDGDTVVVSSPEVTEAKNVRYAYRASAFGQANLYNREGLPAVPFKTDSW